MVTCDGCGSKMLCFPNIEINKWVITPSSQWCPNCRSLFKSDDEVVCGWSDGHVIYETKERPNDQVCV